MSVREDITKTPPRLAYSCACGWLDLGHMDPTSHRANEGAQSLWDQISRETGPQSKGDSAGYKVVYQQTHAFVRRGIEWKRSGVVGTYWVRRGLSPAERQSVALAIFMEISLGFETMQSDWFYKHVTDSGFSAEDLVSNLIGFYKAIQPAIDVTKICGVVSPADSLTVWDAYGAVGDRKNTTFRPLFFPCAACAPAKPAPKGGTMAGEHRFGGYYVSIAADGKIIVRQGDWLSKYSAAMYKGDTKRVNEFGRLKAGKMEPIANVNLIVTGETIYHVPTYDAAKAAAPAPAPEHTEPWTGDLPTVFRQITPAIKGKLFRDWKTEDELSRGEIIERRYPARWR